MEQFNVGDVVIAKSGGPKMVVISPNGDHSTTVTCQYFNTMTGLFDKIVLFALVVEIWNAEKAYAEAVEDGTFGKRKW